MENGAFGLFGHPFGGRLKRGTICRLFSGSAIQKERAVHNPHVVVSCNLCPTEDKDWSVRIEDSRMYVYGCTLGNTLGTTAAKKQASTAPTRVRAMPATPRLDMPESFCMSQYWCLVCWSNSTGGMERIGAKACGH